jgi:hypothetical protein
MFRKGVFVKRLLLSLVLVSIGLLTTQAQASKKSASPLWGCQLKAKIVVDDSFHFILIKVDKIEAYGVIVCKSLTGHKTKDRVFVRIDGFGVGPGIAFPRQDADLVMLSGKVGVSSPQGMYGQYSLNVGPGVTFIAARVGLDAFGEYTPKEEYAAGFRLQMRELAGIGVDLTGYRMVIMPVDRAFRAKAARKEAKRKASEKAKAQKKKKKQNFTSRWAKQSRNK